jgi:pSer/pThr/pTyr-binding forkhead associated (FHA) protein
METGERFTIGDSAFSVGRLPNCSLVLSDENVSRNHAVIQRVPGGWTLTDHGSTNGTTVNAALVTEVRLQPGDQIVFGATPATFQAR